jgi:hypothetical protein
LVDWDEEPRWKLISDTLGLNKPVPVETYSTSEHLQVDLGIGADATGRLPLGQRTRAGLSAEPVEKLTTGRGGEPKQRRKRTGGGERVRSSHPERPAAAAPASSDEGPEGGEQRSRRRRTRRSGSSSPTGNGQAGAEARQDNRPETPSPSGEQRESGSGDRPGRRRRRRRAGAEVGQHDEATSQPNGGGESAN